MTAKPAIAKIFATMKRFCVVVPERTPRALTAVKTAIAATAIAVIWPWEP